MPGSALHPNIQPGHRLKQRPQPDLQHTSHAYDIRHPPQFSSMDGLPFSFTSQPAAAQAFQYPPHLSISGSSRSSRLHSSPSSSSSSTHADCNCKQTLQKEKMTTFESEVHDTQKQ
ncbi:unnamed protein product [Fusarium graminearum]|nr:unnamed protein product [Fusarium graminearum]CAG2000108.1 unnamed protein product [Fusarium graminearum]VTO91665.1 unnamed protein product [Fusarium graminearum]